MPAQLQVWVRFPDPEGSYFRLVSMFLRGHDIGGISQVDCQWLVEAYFEAIRRITRVLRLVDRCERGSVRGTRLPLPYDI
jgi:hypothetical protein